MDLSDINVVIPGILIIGAIFPCLFISLEVAHITAKLVPFLLSVTILYVYYYTNEQCVKIDKKTGTVNYHWQFIKFTVDENYDLNKFSNITFWRRISHGQSTDWMSSTVTLSGQSKALQVYAKTLTNYSRVNPDKIVGLLSSFLDWEIIDFPKKDKLARKNIIRPFKRVEKFEEIFIIVAIVFPILSVFLLIAIERIFEKIF